MLRHMKVMILSSLIFFNALLHVNMAHASALDACIAIPQDAQRLKCYDGLYRPDGIGVSTIPSAAQDFGQEQIDRNNPTAQSKQQLTELTSTVTKIGHNSRNALVFYLDNDQAWHQTSPKAFTIREADNVTIRRGRMGGYILTTERGGSTRVKRLR